MYDNTIIDNSRGNSSGKLITTNTLNKKNKAHKRRGKQCHNNYT